MNFASNGFGSTNEVYGDGDHHGNGVGDGGGSGSSDLINSDDYGDGDNHGNGSGNGGQECGDESGGYHLVLACADTTDLQAAVINLTVRALPCC